MTRSTKPYAALEIQATVGDYSNNSERKEQMKNRQLTARDFLMDCFSPFLLAQIGENIMINETKLSFWSPIKEGDVIKFCVSLHIFENKNIRNR
jgi:hypothetical protein